MRKTLTLLIIIILSSCSRDKTIYLKTDNAEGLTEKSVLSLSGLEIGEIENIELNEQGTILIKSTVKNKFNLPIDTEFRIQESGLLGPKMIVLKLGKSKKMISEKDTINLKEGNKIFPNDSLNKDLEKFVNKFTGADKNDSILKELKRLNENLEKQKVRNK